MSEPIDPRLFSFRDGKFYRETDGKEIAQLVEGEIVGLHHKQEKFRPALQSLIDEAQEASNEELPKTVDAEASQELAEDQPDADHVSEMIEKANVELAVKTASNRLTDIIKASPNTPRDLFSKRLGDQTPAVVEWRKENWVPEQFEAYYGTGS